jgi:ABC-type amino acid transport substrate-binding protein
MPRSAGALLSLSLLCALVAGRSEAASPSGTPKLIVGTNLAPPFSIRNPDGTWSGISIDLWRAIADELRLDYEIRELSFPEVLEGLRQKKIDAAVAALTITAEREKIFDFTHAFYTSGLSIATTPNLESSWLGTLGRLLSGEVLELLGWLIVALFASGLLVWALERKRNEGQFGGGPAQGIWAGFWWSMVTFTSVGYGDKSPVTFWGRVVAIVWMLVSLIILSVFTGAIASVLTVKQLESPVRGPEDLHRVRTATVRNTASASYLNSNRIRFRPYPTLVSALQALSSGETDAVVFDAPILRYFALNEVFGRMRVLPNTFGRQPYGFGLKEGSPLREGINRVLLRKISEPAWEDTLFRYIGRD